MALLTQIPEYTNSTSFQTFWTTLSNACRENFEILENVLLKTAQTLSAAEQAQVLTNLGIQDGTNVEF